ncbi:hypothetical protein LEMLEM_LOCUS102, partial [Lemmus lemmus]
YKLNKQDRKERTADLCQDKVKKKSLQTILLHRKVYQRYQSSRQRRVPQHCRGTLGDCPGGQLFLEFLTFFGSHLLAHPASSGK